MKMNEFNKRILSFTNDKDDYYCGISGFYGENEKLSEAVEFIEILDIFKYSDSYWPFPSTEGDLYFECMNEDDLFDDVILTYNIHTQIIGVQSFLDGYPDIDLQINRKEAGDDGTICTFDYIMRSLERDLKNEKDS